MKSMTSVDAALAECLVSIETGVGLIPIDSVDLGKFVSKFQRDFAGQLKDSTAWQRDRLRITTLARAIGGFAAFLAISQKGEGRPKIVKYAHLWASFKELGPKCQQRTATKGKTAGVGKYCQGVLNEIGEIS